MNECDYIKIIMSMNIYIETINYQCHITYLLFHMIGMTVYNEHLTIKAKYKLDNF